MKKNLILTSLICIFLSSQTLAQDIFEKVEKQYTIETGYQHIFNTDSFSPVSGGYTLAVDYAWKLSGYNKKANAYISVPLGYLYMFDEDNSYSILYYGWTVRHELSKNKKLTPYLGYALLLNQYKNFTLAGSIFGHQTRFDFGINYALKERLKLFAKIEYSYSRFPSPGNDKSNKMHTGGVKLGLRF